MLGSDYRTPWLMGNMTYWHPSMRWQWQISRINTDITISSKDNGTDYSASPQMFRIKIDL